MVTWPWTNTAVGTRCATVVSIVQRFISCQWNGGTDKSVALLFATTFLIFNLSCFEWQLRSCCLNPPQGWKPTTKNNTTRYLEKVKVCILDRPQGYSTLPSSRSSTPWNDYSKHQRQWRKCRCCLYGKRWYYTWYYTLYGKWPNLLWPVKKGLIVQPSSFVLNWEADTCYFTFYDFDRLQNANFRIPF